MRKAHHRARLIGRIYGIMNIRWVFDDDTVVISFNFLPIKCRIFVNNYKNVR